MGKFESIHRTTDLNGVVVAETRNVFEIKKLPGEPPFIKMYIDDLSRLYELQAGQHQILHCIIAGVDYAGIVSVTGARKARIAEMLNISSRSIDNALTEYVRSGILIRIGRGEYELDPKLFAKGQWRDICERRKEFQAKITYSKSGRKIEMLPLDEPMQKVN